MHLTLIFLAVTLAVLVRVLKWRYAATWINRWQQTLFAFMLPPLLLLMTAIAVLCMGTQGQMLGLPAGWMGYLLALSFLGVAVGFLVRLAWLGWRSLRQIQTYPAAEMAGATGRILDTSQLFAAQVGFWQSQLVVSQGLLDRLTPEQLDAVLRHEQAHAYYRDTFWFFWMGWLRHFTAWLPNTRELWQELLLLRELRADQWASQTVDPLILAESLLLTVQDSAAAPDLCAAFSAVAPLSRLEERIEALLSPKKELSAQFNGMALVGLAVALIPLLTVLFHR